MTDDLQIRTLWVGDARADEAIALDNEAWYAPPEDNTPEMMRERLDWSLMAGAEEPDGRLVGILGGIEQQLTVPGPGESLVQVPCYGLTWAGVHSDVRRKGVFRRLMQMQLERAVADGRPVVSLYASEHTIYPRFGFGVATYETTLTLSSDEEFEHAPAAAKAAADGIRTRLVLRDSDAAREAQRALRPAWAAGQLGAVLMPDRHVEAHERDVPVHRREEEPWHVVVAERDGQVVGIAHVSREQKWEDGSPSGKASVALLLALDDGALLALLRRLTSFDLIPKTELWKQPGSGSGVVSRWVGGPRAASPWKVCDGLYLRIVEVPAALTARGYAPGELSLVIAVLDEQLPATRGPWRLTIDTQGAATVIPAPDAAPDLTLPVQVLGAAYLGQDSLLTLAATAHAKAEVVEHTPGTLAALSRAMRRDDEALPAYGF